MLSDAVPAPGPSLGPPPESPPRRANSSFAGSAGSAALFGCAACARKNTVNCWLERRCPAPYTASYSARLTRRMARGNPCRDVPVRPCLPGSPRAFTARGVWAAGGSACPCPSCRRAEGWPASEGKFEFLDGRETMASLFAPRRQDLAAAFGLHARAKAVCLVATAHFRLKGAFRQRVLPLSPPNQTKSNCVV
jgi:hypothetical protein